MLSRWLRRFLAIEAVLFALAGAILFRAGELSLGTAAAFAVAGFLGVNIAIVTLVVMATYAFSFRHAQASPEGLKMPFLRLCRMVVMEWRATMLLFIIIQPFERWWMGADPIRRKSGRTTVVLVHGYCCNRGFWCWLRSGLRSHGIQAATLNLEPPFASLDDLAACLHSRMSALSAKSGSEEVVLVGHSMGGLVARTYLRRYGPGPVTKVITLGSPHHGTDLARLGVGRNAREMEPGSDWLHQWAEAEALSVPTISVRSACDNYVIPSKSSFLANASNIVLPSLGHLSMAFSPDVLKLLLREIADVAGSTDGDTGDTTRNAPPATAE